MTDTGWTHLGSLITARVDTCSLLGTKDMTRLKMIDLGLATRFKRSYLSCLDRG